MRIMGAGKIETINLTDRDTEWLEYCQVDAQIEWVPATSREPLQAMGLIAFVDKYQGHSIKRIYKITDKGRAYLIALGKLKP